MFTPTGDVMQSSPTYTCFKRKHIKKPCTCEYSNQFSSLTTSVPQRAMGAYEEMMIMLLLVYDEPLARQGRRMWLKRVRSKPGMSQLRDTFAREEIEQL